MRTFNSLIDFFFPKNETIDFQCFQKLMPILKFMGLQLIGPRGYGCRVGLDLALWINHSCSLLQSFPKWLQNTQTRSFQNISILWTTSYCIANKDGKKIHLASIWIWISPSTNLLLSMFEANFQSHPNEKMKVKNWNMS